MRIGQYEIGLFEKTNCTLMLLPVSGPFWTRSLLGLFLHDTVEASWKSYCNLYFDFFYFQFRIFHYQI